MAADILVVLVLLGLHFMAVRSRYDLRYLPPSAFESWFVNAALSGEALDRVLAALPAAARAAAEVGA